MKCVPVVLAAFVLFLFASRIGTLVHIPGWAVAIAAILIGVPANYIMARGFRCPGCNSNLLIHAQALDRSDSNLWKINWTRAGLTARTLRH